MCELLINMSMRRNQEPSLGWGPANGPADGSLPCSRGAPPQARQEAGGYLFNFYWKQEESSHFVLMLMPEQNNALTLQMTQNNKSPFLTQKQNKWFLRCVKEIKSTTVQNCSWRLCKIGIDRRLERFKCVPKGSPHMGQGLHSGSVMCAETLGDDEDEEEDSCGTWSWGGAAGGWGGSGALWTGPGLPSSSWVLVVMNWPTLSRQDLIPSW